MTDLKDDKELNEFRVGEILYKGEVADIWGGVHSSTGTPVHVVIVNKKKIGHVVDELRIEKYAPKVREITNPHVLKYHRMVQNEIQMGIIMEHPKGGSIHNFILSKKEKLLYEGEARVLFKQMVSALDCLHSLQIVHGGINLKNVFVDDTLLPPHVKLGDFLICSRLGLHKSNTANSCHFFPPEMWTEEGNELPTDIWSLGVLLYVMICGCYPFDGKNEMDLFGCIRRGVFNLPNSVSDECAHLIKSMLVLTPAERITILGVKNHSWLSDTHTSDNTSQPVSPAPPHHRRTNSTDSMPEEHLPSSPSISNVMEKMRLEESVMNDHTSFDTGFNDYSSDSEGSVKSEDFSSSPSAFGIPPFTEPPSRRKKNPDLLGLAARNNMKMAHSESSRVYSSAPNSPTEFTPAFPESFEFKYQDNLSISTSKTGTPAQRSHSDTSIINSAYFQNLFAEDNNSEKKARNSPPGSPKRGKKTQRRRSLSDISSPYPNPAKPVNNYGIISEETPSLAPPVGVQQTLKQSTSLDSAQGLYKQVSVPARTTEFDQVFLPPNPQATTSFSGMQRPPQHTLSQMNQFTIQLGPPRVSSMPNFSIPVYHGPSPIQTSGVQVNTIPLQMNPVQVQSQPQPGFGFMPQQLINQQTTMVRGPMNVPSSPVQQLPHGPTVQMPVAVKPQPQPVQPVPQSPSGDYADIRSFQSPAPSQQSMVYEFPANFDIDALTSVLGDAPDEKWLDSVINP